MRVLNSEAVCISNKIIRDVLIAYHRHLIRLPFSEVNSLTSELHRWSIQGLKTGVIPYLSNSKISQLSSENMARHLYFEIRNNITNFNHFNQQHGSSHLYGYEFTINPTKLTYSNVNEVNRKIIHKLKLNHHIALIERATEHTYCNQSINVHLHYLVIATSRINQKNTYRAIKSIARHLTHGNVNQSKMDSKPYRQVDDWTKAIDYVTKQCGRFPKMMNHHQWQKFDRLTYSQQISLLVKDFNTGKGVEQHRLYTNSRNSIARRWHTIQVNRNYCRKNGLLVNVHQSQRDVTKNARQTVFDKSLDKIIKSKRKHKNVTKPYTKHHYSEIEALSRLYGHGVYGLEKRQSRVKSMSLFEN